MVHSPKPVSERPKVKVIRTHKAEETDVKPESTDNKLGDTDNGASN